MTPLPQTVDIFGDRLADVRQLKLDCLKRWSGKLIDSWRKNPLFIVARNWIRLSPSVWATDQRL